MITIQRTVDIPANRRLSFDLPETVPVGRTSVVLEISTTEVAALPAAQMPAAETTPETAEAQDTAALKIILPEQIKPLLRDNKSVPKRYSNEALDLREAHIAIAFRAGKSHDGQSYKKYAGCLKDSAIFEGDSVLIQRKMRREWD